MTKINISIPQPCHENWQAMTSVEKGKFCNACQKKVFDFTSSSDREIINAFEKDNNLCGRFLNTQLDRDLVKPKEKSTLWLATTTALISLIGINEVTAQKKAPTEQTDQRMVGKFLITPGKEEILVSGIVYDENKTPMPNLGIYIKSVKVGQTNDNGNFSINTHLKARIQFRVDSNDYDEESTEYYVRDNFGNTNIEINAVKYNRRTMTSIVGATTIIKNEVITKHRNRTFLARVFHSIGNWFR